MALFLGNLKIKDEPLDESCLNIEFCKTELHEQDFDTIPENNFNENNYENYNENDYYNDFQADQNEESFECSDFDCKYNCDFCGHCFIESENPKKDLKIHMKKHKKSGIKKKKIETSEDVIKDEIKVEDDENMENEENVKNSGNPLPFQCDFCEKSFSRIWILRRHTSTVHESEKHIKCDMCDKAFNRMDSLRYSSCA